MCSLLSKVYRGDSHMISMNYGEAWRSQEREPHLRLRRNPAVGELGP